MPTPNNELLPVECLSIAYFKFGTEIVLFSQDLQNPDVLVDMIVDIERRCDNRDDRFNLNYDCLDTADLPKHVLYCASIYSGLYGKRTKVELEAKKSANVEDILDSHIRYCQHYYDYASFILMDLNLESAQARELLLSQKGCMSFMIAFNSVNHNKGLTLPNGAYVPFDNNESDIYQSALSKLCLHSLQKFIATSKSLGLTEKGYAVLKLDYFLSVNLDLVLNEKDRERIRECRRKLDVIIYSRLTTYLDVTDSNIDISHLERFTQLQVGLKTLLDNLIPFAIGYFGAVKEIVVDLERSKVIRDRMASRMSRILTKYKNSSASM